MTEKTYIDGLKAALEIAGKESDMTEQEEDRARATYDNCVSKRQLATRLLAKIEILIKEAGDPDPDDDDRALSP